jgi:hypothetical protein
MTFTVTTFDSDADLQAYLIANVIALVEIVSITTTHSLGNDLVKHTLVLDTTA